MIRHRLTRKDDKSEFFFVQTAHVIFAPSAEIPDTFSTAISKPLVIWVKLGIMGNWFIFTMCVRVSKYYGVIWLYYNQEDDYIRDNT